MRSPSSSPLLFPPRSQYITILTPSLHFGTLEAPFSLNPPDHPAYPPEYRAPSPRRLRTSHARVYRHTHCVPLRTLDWDPNLPSAHVWPSLDCQTLDPTAVRSPQGRGVEYPVQHACGQRRWRNFQFSAGRPEAALTRVNRQGLIDVSSHKL